MSIKIMSQIWESPHPDGAAERLVLLALADNANDQGICWPSMETIARKCRVSRRYVIKILSELEGLGFITKQKHRNRSNTYRIMVDRLGSEPQFTSEPLFTPVVNPSSPGSEPQFTPVVNYSSPESSINHQVESPVDPSFLPPTAAKKNHPVRICEQVRRELGIDVTRRTKVNGELIRFLEGLPAHETIPKFAEWWRSTWPGNTGQPPRANQIMELWPSAFNGGKAEVARRKYESWTNSNG